MFNMRAASNIKSEHVGQLSVTYGDVSKQLGVIIGQKPYLKEVLDFYKSNFI